RRVLLRAAPHRAPRLRRLPRRLLRAVLPRARPPRAVGLEHGGAPLQLARRACRRPRRRRRAPRRPRPRLRPRPAPPGAAGPLDRRRRLRAQPRGAGPAAAPLPPRLPHPGRQLAGGPAVDAVGGAPGTAREGRDGMRVWSVHPRYLDRQGLVACWRETLLAQAVLAGRTKGYLNHSQLVRFRATADPLASVCAYLGVLAVEADERGYRFDRSRIDRAVALDAVAPLPVTEGQVAYEWAHLLAKLATRS